MRVIEKQLLNAINERKNVTLGNTRVFVTDNGNCMLIRLHGYLIAKINLSTKEVSVSNCGWFTNVTKSRLNVVLSAFNLPTIKQVKGEWYIGHEDFALYNMMAKHVNN